MHNSQSPVPPEIIRTIFEHLGEDTSSFYKLTLTSKLFNSEATRLLYRSMILEDGRKHRMFFSALKKNPKLAPLVRKYHTPSTVQPPKLPLWPLLAHCTPLMTGLKELSYRDVWKEMKLGLPRKIEGQPFPFQLDKFIWTADLNLQASGRKFEIIDFLDTQRNLRDIMSLNYSLARIIPDTLFPDLKIVEGGISFIRLLVPSRPSVSEVYWRCFSQYDLEGLMDPHSILHEHLTDKLRGISLPVYAWRPLIYSDDRLLDMLLLISQRLEILEIFFPDCPQMYQFLLVVHRFPRLRRISIRLKYQTKQELDLDQTLCLFNRCQNLMYLDISIAGDLYERWVSRGAASTVVTITREFVLRLPETQ